MLFNSALFLYGFPSGTLLALLTADDESLHPTASEINLVTYL